MAVVTSADDNSSSVVQKIFKILKVLLLVLGLISSVVMLKGPFLGFSCEFVVGFWNSLRCFLSSPLYICIIINSIVLLIAALSSFQPHDAPPPPPPPQSSDKQLDEREKEEEDEEEDTMEATWKTIKDKKYLTKSETFVQDPPPPAEKKDLKKSETFNEREEEEEDDEEENTMEATWKAIKDKKYLTKSVTFIQEPRPAPAAAVAAAAAKKNLKKSETFNEREKEEEDTMEATWNAIKDKKYLTKSETFVQDPPPRAEKKNFKKSETFNEAVAIRRRGGMRRDPSVGIDEFNQQVEAFIKKFTDDMRLQRQESDQRFIDMINRGL